MYLKACRILGVRVGANQVEIKKAYRSLAKVYHPDVSSERNAKEKFIQVRRAYLFLSNEDAYQHFLNGQNPVRRRPVNNPHRPTRRYAQHYERTQYKEYSGGVEAPEYVIRLGTFLEKIYDYIFLIIGGIMILSPPIYFLLDEELEVEELGWYPIVIPAIVGLLFIAGVFAYMNNQKHPFANKLKQYFYKRFPWVLNRS